MTDPLFLLLGVLFAIAFYGLLFWLLGKWIVWVAKGIRRAWKD